MIFAASTFLYLLPLAGLPILFHLVLKQKKRTIVFSTLMFFHRVDPKLNTRRQIREWLLLLMRVLMIALILLALSRPSLRSAIGSGGKLSLVAIVDNSGSMSAGSKDGDLTKLECAKEGARKLLSSLEPDADAALVLLVEDSAVAAPELLSADRAALLKCLDRINPTEASGDASRALAQAFDLLHKSTAGGGVVHVFTDLQQVEWAENAKRLEAREDRVHVYLHKIATSPLLRANVAVTAVQLPEQRLLVGQPYEVGLSLHNNSDSEADVRVNCINSQGERGTQSLSLQKQEIATVRLPVTMNEQGYHWLKAWIEGDGFAADNAAGIGLFCEGTGTVLFVGQPKEFGVLPMAISPSGRGQLTGLITKFSPSIQDVGWASAHADNSGTGGQEQHGLKPILLVTTWGALAAAGSNPTELMKYIEGGGNLLVVPSLLPGSDTSVTQAPAWLGAGIRPREAYKSGVRLAILSRDAPFWRQIEQVVGDVSAEPIAAYAFCPLDLSAGLTPLLGAGAKKVVLAHKTLGKGNVFVSGIAFSPRWSTLPLSGLGVVMAQRMAVCSVPVRASKETPDGVTTNTLLPLVAGERPQILPGDGETQLLSLSGDALEWKGRPTEMPAFPRTGVYLATTGDQKCCISVRASPREGEYRFVEGSNVPILGSISHTVVPFDAQENYAQYHAGQARVTELYIPLLLLATLAVLVEGLLGAAKVRSRRVCHAHLPFGWIKLTKGVHGTSYKLLGRHV
jgi:hypothetical protein